MSEDKASFFEKVKGAGETKRIPPSPNQTKGALNSPARKETAKEETVVFSFRAKEETRETVRELMYTRRMKQKEIFEQAIEAFANNGVLPAPTEKPEIKQPKDPRDRDAGRNVHLDIWGNDGTVAALERLAEIQECSPSELVKIMLIERTQKLEEEGVETGLIVK